MKKIINEFNEVAYEYTTESGLHVMLVHRPGFNRSIASYGTPFGSLDLVQSFNGTEVKHKTGVAHFLEHKLFEDETNDVFTQFAEYGASANAFTSYDRTVYYFTTNSSLTEPLRILLGFVSRFSLNQERVDKEKGIITEELRMYAKMPDMNLLMKTYQNVYHTFPMKVDIGGTEEDVNAMLLEDLRTAYDLNYADTKMGLVVVTGESLAEVKDIIDAATKSHPFVEHEVLTHFEEEQLSVVKHYEEIYDLVQTPKMSLSYKFGYNGSNILLDEHTVRLILELNFSELNDDYQTWLDDEIISDGFGYDVDLRDGFGVIYFFNDGDNAELFKQLIDGIMRNLLIPELEFQQLVKRNYGLMIMSLNQYDRFAQNLLLTSFKGINYYDYLKEVRDLSIDACMDMLSNLHDMSTSFVVMKPIVG